MLIFFILLIVLIAMGILVFHISLEINSVEKSTAEFETLIRGHYEPETLE